jgi:hypothetical protein
MRLVTYLLAAVILWAVASTGPASSTDAAAPVADGHASASPGRTHGK